ncbi:hypothetical protein ADIAL_0179 [Alkalibacterium sp. AK22]|uniref:hypothetical protein n=1 Tax=Alkalibacterium sp. AK22 TaxID=1229520 RepID=UPI00044C4D2E|nr:hypothetical protein [Alkalibacterium sp. AK22]EXJ24440.1 hypothetical protein ADIAL_0179 [Alkalibacterium sp. AK22]
MDLSEARRKKTRGMSNEEFLNTYTSAFLESESLVVISFDQNNVIRTFQSSDSQLTALGMIEVAKQQIIDDMADA